MVWSQIYPVYNDLRVRRQSVMERAVASSLTLAFLAYSTIGLLACTHHPPPTTHHQTSRPTHHPPPSPG